MLEKNTNLKKLLFFVIFLLITGCTNNVYTTKNTPDNTSRIYYLPKGNVNLKIVREKDDAPIAVTLTPSIVPDTSVKLFLNRNHSNLYNDHYIIETDKNGLLKSINTTSNYQGGEILKTLGAIGGKAAQIAALCKPVKSAITCKPKAFEFEIDLDPYEDEPKIVNDKIDATQCVFIDFAKMKIDNPLLKNTNGTYSDSILYRSVADFTLNIKSKEPEVVKSLTVALPDLTKIESFDVERGNFVDREIDLTFSDGILTKDDSTYPSEVLGFLSLPLELLNGISQAITGRFDTKTLELQNEKKYVDSIKELNASKAK